MNYLDANFIAALHFNIAGHTDLAETFVRKAPLPFVVSGLGELECRRAFIRRAGHSQSENWLRFQERLDGGAWLRLDVEWAKAEDRAAALMEKLRVKVNCGTLDILHVALAQMAGCTWFLSFDTNSNARVLAASARLKVYPELSPSEKGRVVH